MLYLSEPKSPHRLCFFFFLHCTSRRDLHSFPTRRSSDLCGHGEVERRPAELMPHHQNIWFLVAVAVFTILRDRDEKRSEEHTSELQSRPHLVCRLLLEKKKYRRNLSVHVFIVGLLHDYDH